MSGVSSSRTRTKTADFAQFFRGYPSRQSSQNEPVESPHLSVPDDSQSPTPKKSKLPFLYRTRKKSTPSVKSGILPSMGRGYESEAAELPTTTATTAKKDRRLSHPGPSPEQTIKKGPTPAVKSIPQINVSSPSLGSKFVAHFSNSKLRKVPSSQSTKVAPCDGNTRDRLSPTYNPAASIYSSTTTTTTTSSAIPPPTPDGTVIAITSAPGNLEAYSNLFTLSKAKKTTIPRRQSSTPASEYRDNYNKTEPNVPSSPSSPSFPRLDPSAPGFSGSRLPSSSRNETKERDSRQSTGGSKTFKLSKRVPGAKLAEDSTPKDFADESVLHLRSGDLTPTIDVSPPPPPIKAASPTRSRLRTSSAIKDTRASDPPSIPLPDPPVMNNSPSASPTSPSSPRLATVPPSTSILKRPRANTTGSVPLSPVTAATITAGAPSLRQSPKLSGENFAVKKSSNKEISDLDRMTVEQLKEALAQRNQQYAELTTHLLEVTKSHAVEKATLEKKIAALVTEVARKDKEIQGFTWMLNNRGTQPPDDDVDYTRIPGPRIQRSPSAASSKISSRRIQQGDDSGAESPSGTESVPGSGGSVRSKRGLRPLTLGESNYSLYRSSISSKASSRGPAFDSGLSDQRTSVYSLSSLASASATSSSSSLLPPSPSIAYSSLSAIPEISVVTPSRVVLPRISTSRRDSASEWETDPEKKSHDVVQSSKHVSASSLSSSSSSATSSYAANLKRGRPPSIAQVLHKSGTMDDVLEKLRPFATAVPTAAEA